MIEFRDVAVCYAPDQRYPSNALEGINLHVGPGEWVFVVGPSGAGKSTLLKLVYHGAQATRGAVLVDGQDVTQLPAREIPLLRRKIGVIFQDFQLLTQKTVWENVAFALQVIGAPQRRLVRDVPRALETVGLHNKADARPHELSGGEQQRVAIARAIVNDPLILISDEPTGNLDPRTAEDIAEVLRRINERGTTILMATHDRHLVDNMHKRVVRIAEGRVTSDEIDGIYHPEDDEPGAGRSYAGQREANAESNVDGSRGATESHSLSSVHPPGENGVVHGVTPGPGPSSEVQNSSFAAGPPITDEPSYLHRTRANQAPLGSPENPIVQLDRVTAPRVPH